MSNDMSDLRPAEFADVALTAAEVAAMHRLVASHAHNDDDARLLLDALMGDDR
jgi:hypothetical protein